MARLRVGDIGSISAWLPSRRSVESQRGARVMLFVGQVRSGRSTGLNGTYRWHGMPLGCWWTGATDGYVRLLGIVACFLRGMSALGFDGGQRTCLGPATREPALQAPAAAAKEEQLVRHIEQEHSSSNGPVFHARPHATRSRARALTAAAPRPVKKQSRRAGAARLARRHAHRSKGTHRTGRRLGSASRSCGRRARSTTRSGRRGRSSGCGAGSSTPPIPRRRWICRDETTGAVQGWYFMFLPQRENRDRAYGYLTVHPSSRRRGIGTALLRHAAERAASNGRSVLGSGAFQGSAGAAFAARAGATAGLVEARRVLVLGKIPAAASRRCGSRPRRRRPGTRWCPGTAAPPRSTWPGTPRWRTRWRTRRTTTARSPRSGTPPGSGSRSTTSASGRAGTSTRWRRCTTRAARWRRSPRSRPTRTIPSGDISRSRRWSASTAGTGSACWSRPRCSTGWRRRSRASSGSSPGTPPSTST